MTSLDIDAAIRHVEDVFGPFAESDGIAASRIDAAEQRLGLSFPRALVSLYQRTGAHPLHQACDRLLSPERLRLEERHLVFYEQDQRAMDWAIPVDTGRSVNPPVVVRFGDGTYETETDSFAEFFLFIIASQATEGGAQYYASTDEPPAVSGHPIATCRHGEVFIRSPEMLLRRPNEPFLGLASNDRPAFERAAEALGLAPEAWTFHSHVR